MAIPRVSQMEMGRMMVKKHAPYMYRLVYSLIPYPTEEIPTLGVTPGMVVYYNPKFMETLDNLECGGVLLHEGMHPHLRHDARRGARDHEKWNVAGDATINPPIVETGLKIPSFCIFPEKVGLPVGKTTEWYYNNWPTDPTSKAAGGKKPGKGQPGVGNGQCGGCAGNPGPYGELEKRIDQEMGRSSGDRERIQKQVAASIQAHINEHGRGSIPALFSSWAETILAPARIAWEAELKSTFRTAYGQAMSGGQDYSLARPSKRSITRGIIRPGLVDYQPEVAVILDTSGSMGVPTGLQIQSGLRETAGLLRELGVGALWFIEADAAVAMRPKRITVNDLRRIEIKGGGGTDFGPAIHAATLLQPRPNIVAYMTDGDGACPKEPPHDMTVIWAIVPGRWSVKRPLPWGKTIFIKE